MIDSFESRSFGVLEGEVHLAVLPEELIGATARVPLRLEARHQPPDLGKIHPIASRVWAPPFGVLDLRSGDDFADDVGEIPYPVVFLALADVESLIEDSFARGAEHREKCARDVLHVNDRAPRAAIALDVHAAFRVRPSDELVEDEIESQ